MRHVTNVYKNVSNPFAQILYVIQFWNSMIQSAKRLYSLPLDDDSNVQNKCSRWHLETETVTREQQQPKRKKKTEMSAFWIEKWNFGCHFWNCIIHFCAHTCTPRRNSTVTFFLFFLSLVCVLHLRNSCFSICLCRSLVSEFRCRLFCSVICEWLNSISIDRLRFVQFAYAESSIFDSPLLSFLFFALSFPCVCTCGVCMWCVHLKNVTWTHLVHFSYFVFHCFFNHCHSHNTEFRLYYASIIRLSLALCGVHKLHSLLALDLFFFFSGCQIVDCINGNAKHEKERR